MKRYEYKYVIFDVDGTLADPSHRLHHVREKPKNWPAFMMGVSHDTVIWPVYAVLESLAASGLRIILVSGREEILRKPTEDWFKEHGLGYHELLMRGAKDYRADEIVKKEIFESRFPVGEREFILGVFDDRPKVIRMWRDLGLKVFDVGSGVEF